MNKNWEIEIYNDINDIKELWQDFEEKESSYCFQTFTWILNWQNTLSGENKRPKYIVGYYKKELFMLLPLVVEKKYFSYILNFVGGDYSNGIFIEGFTEKVDKKSFIRLWKNIVKKISGIDIVYFNNQPKTIKGDINPFIKYLNNYIAYSSSKHVVIDSTWEDYLLSLSKKFRYDTNRQIKRLGKKGVVSFVIAKDRDEELVLVEKMIEYKRQRYKMTNHDDQFDNSQNILFYSYFDNFERNNQFKVHISAIKLDNKIIAVHWGIIHDNIFYYLMPANDWGENSKYSPGRILLLELLNWSFDNKLKIFDFTIGGESYKSKWTNGSINVYKHINHFSIKGLIVATGLKIHYLLKYRKLHNNDE